MGLAPGERGPSSVDFQKHSLLSHRVSARITSAPQVVPDAFRVTRLKPGRRYCVLGRISDEIGWKFKDTVERLEAKRKASSAVYYDTKKAELAKADAAAKAVPGDAILAKFGY